MVRKIVAIAALSGTMALGAAGVASAASSTPSPSPSPSNTISIPCSKALTFVHKVNAREAKLAAWVPKAQARAAAATKAGNTTQAARINRRVTRIQKLEARGHRVESRIASVCGTGS